jgi:hypothetical protein
VPWEVVVRREVEPLIDALKGKRAGYGDAVRQLEIDPCAEFERPAGDPRPFAYRLSGPLEPKVCGVHLKRDYRLAFTMRPADRDGIDGIVEILFVGRRDTRDRSKDTWQIVHDLFGEENPPEGHLRPPCCRDGLPALDPHELDDFMQRLRRFVR